MGETLSKPVVTKETSKGASAKLGFAQSCMQGYRYSMRVCARTSAPVRTGAR